MSADVCPTQEKNSFIFDFFFFLGENMLTIKCESYALWGKTILSSMEINLSELKQVKYCWSVCFNYKP